MFKVVIKIIGLVFELIGIYTVVWKWILKK